MKKRKFKFFRNAVIFIQSFVLLLTCTTPVFALPLNESNLIFNVKAKTEFKDLNSTNKSVINTAIKTFNVDGIATAKSVNEIKNKEAFEIGVRKVLDKYYSTEKAKRGELTDFSKTIDSSATYILENYKEAEAERDNKENLPYETEEVLVSFPYGTPMETIETIVGNEAVSYELIDDGKYDIPDELPDYKKERLKVLENVRNDIVILANISLEDTVKRASEKFDEYSLVTETTDNTLFEADGTIGNVSANDEYFGDDADEQWNLDYINIAPAWNRFRNLNGIWEIWVAVIDSGVKMNHPDLTNILLKNYSVDVTNNNKKLIDCPSEKAKHGQYTSNHGTMVAGVLMAQGNNGIGIAGVASVASDPVCPNPFKLMAIKCDDSVGEDRHINKAHLHNAIHYAVSHGADVINISYSAEDLETSYANIQTAIHDALDAGVSVVCAAGNDADDDGKDGTDVRYPAGFPGVIGVGATLKNGRMAAYSNRSTAVDIVAPGGYKYDTGAQILSTNIDGDYSDSYGTSFATPHVAGTIAMMKSINAGFDPDEYLDMLLDGEAPSDIHGFIELNAGKAVRNIAFG